MKIFTVVLLTLLRLHAWAQPSYWDEKAIQTNKVKEVSIFHRYYKPDSTYTLSLKYWAAFDDRGRITESNCQSCVAQTHAYPPAADVIEKFTYEKDLLTRIDAVDFDSTIVHFFYESGNRKCLQATTDAWNNRQGIRLDYLDSQGRSTISFDINFSNPHPEDEDESRVFIDKIITAYKDKKITTQRYGTRELVNLGIPIPLSSFKVLQYATSPAEVENTLNNLHLDLSPFKPEVTKTKNGRIQVTDMDTGVVKKIYYLGADGLIIKEERRNDDYRSHAEYTYKYAR